ncbi:MAG: DUF6036 family nucleotidyltransferase [Chitinophagaceae bacterium]
MDAMDEELISFWRKLGEKGVRYIMVGGLATRFHGFNRATDDLDMWLEDTLENRKKLRATFKELDYGDFPPIETMEFIPGWTSFHVAGIVLDIMTEIKGLESYSFEECYNLTVHSVLDKVSVPFLHINHLIESKKATNRPKDQIDIIELEKIKSLKK